MKNANGALPPRIPFGNAVGRNFWDRPEKIVCCSAHDERIRLHHELPGKHQPRKIAILVVESRSESTSRKSKTYIKE